MRATDVIVVGGGPAGLTAALYLARFHLRVLVIADGRSRASTIPVSHNHAGFPQGVPGAELVARMEAQAAEYGVAFAQGQVTRLTGTAGHFEADAARTFRGRAVLLATGVVNNRPPMAGELHDRAVAQGRLRYCPICDGYEVTDRNVGVIGTGAHGLNEVMFLRSYTRTLALIAPEGPHDLDASQRAQLAAAGVVAIDGPATDFDLDDDGIGVMTASGHRRFDSLYPALGTTVNSELAATIGARLGSDNSILVDRHQRTSVAGVYAAGDVVLGLDQISHAMGEAGVAATAIRNDLAEVTPIWR